MLQVLSRRGGRLLLNLVPPSSGSYLSPLTLAMMATSEMPTHPSIISMINQVGGLLPLPDGILGVVRRRGEVLTSLAHGSYPPKRQDLLLRSELLFQRYF